MPRHKESITKSPEAKCIYEALVAYAKTHQAIPVQHTLLQIVRSQGHQMTVDSFGYWFDRLIEAGYIEIVTPGRSIRVRALQIVERDDFTPMWSPESRSTRGYVYVLKSAEHGFKIGATVDPESRLRGLQRDCPFPVEYVHIIECNCYKDVEKQLHLQYADKLLGGEWFDLSEVDLRELRKLTSISTKLGDMSLGQAIKLPTRRPRKKNRWRKETPAHQPVLFEMAE